MKARSKESMTSKRDPIDNQEDSAHSGMITAPGLHHNHRLKDAMRLIARLKPQQ